MNKSATETDALVYFPLYAPYFILIFHNLLKIERENHVEYVFYAKWDRINVVTD